MLVLCTFNITFSSFSVPGAKSAYKCAPQMYKTEYENVGSRQKITVWLSSLTILADNSNKLWKEWDGNDAGKSHINSALIYVHTDAWYVNNVLVPKTLYFLLHFAQSSSSWWPGLLYFWCLILFFCFCRPSFHTPWNVVPSHFT